MLIPGNIHRLLISLLFITGITSSQTADDSSGKILKVFILAGQSNAVGYNNINEYHGDIDKLEKRIGQTSDVLLWPGSNARKDIAGKWIKIQPGVSGISGSAPYHYGCFGPELGFSMKLKELIPEENIALIKFAEGGTGIARSSDYSDYIPALNGFNDKGINWHPPVNGTEAGQLYSGLFENIRNALSSLERSGIKYEIKGFIWMQGEHEAGISKKMAGDYEKILSSFIQSVRKDLGIPDLPFIIGEINSHQWAFADLAREKQTEVCIDDPRSVLVKSVDLTRNGVGDKAHFDADGMITLGERFADAILYFLRDAEKDKNPITFESLLREMTDRTVIAQLPAIEYRLFQASSYDRRSVEKDKDGWYANNDWSNYIRKDTLNGRVEYVLMDATGPGAITRFWAGGHPNQPNNLRFYIDGNEAPFWRADHTGALIGQNKEIGIPLSQRTVDNDFLNINDGAQPGHNLYAPIPFRERLKITTDCEKAGADKGFWYNINYRLYDKAADMESFSKKTPAYYYETLKATSKILNDFMKLSPADVRFADEKKTLVTEFSIIPAKSKALHLKGEGSVRRILISLNTSDLNDAVKNTWIRIDFDGKQTVEAPLGFIFGCGDQLAEAGDWYRKIDMNGNMSCFWVMPYRSKAVIYIVNRGEIPVAGKIEVATGDWTWNDRSLYFHADLREIGEMPEKTTKDFNILSLRNQAGIYAGDMMLVYKAFQGWWGEGDEKIYIDGSIFPDHFGTGSEDYYGYSWGHPEIFNNIFNGQTVGNANTGPSGVTVNSRVRSLDAIFFKNSLQFDMESWQLSGGKVIYKAACYWYGKCQ